MIEDIWEEELLKNISIMEVSKDRSGHYASFWARILHSKSWYISLSVFPFESCNFFREDLSDLVAAANWYRYILDLAYLEKETGYAKTRLE